MKIVLIQCPVWGTYDPPIGLAQLAGCLKEAQQDVFVFDLNIKLYRSRTANFKDMWAWEQSAFWYNQENVDSFFLANKSIIDEYAFKALETDSQIFGFSVNAASRLASQKVAKVIKGIKKDAVIIFGGPLFFEEKFIAPILNEGIVDYVIAREAEIVLVNLLQALETGKDVISCKGIHLKHEGKIINTGSVPVVNLDSLPFLDFSQLPLSDYDDCRHIAFPASRGCIQRCAFCSSRAFWPSYRAMSGKRIFKEVEFHYNQLQQNNPDFSHVDFLDLMFNGNMKYLTEFCELVIKSRLNIFWTANMIIRHEMNASVVNKMRKSGCEHIIFGIESGSQRVLDLMKKNYRIKDADRIVKCMHNAGIKVTANFMFGFPGETEGDFQLTLSFLERNARYLDRVYPSRTFFAIEEFSYLSAHIEEFNIQKDIPNHLYWESIDGSNTYPERLRRCEEFCDLASSLGIQVGSGVQTSVELDRWFNLGYYYEHKKDFSEAVRCFVRYYKLNPDNEVISNKIKYYSKQMRLGSDDMHIANVLKEELCSLSGA